jgi:hypothetical protein
VQDRIPRVEKLMKGCGDGVQNLPVFVANRFGKKSENSSDICLFKSPLGVSR